MRNENLKRIKEIAIAFKLMLIAMATSTGVCRVPCVTTPRRLSSARFLQIVIEIDVLTHPGVETE